MKKVSFAGGHVFPFSKREGTLASKMKNQIEKKEKHERCKTLIKVFDDLEEKYYKSFINKEVYIIPESFEDNILIGHSDNYLKVYATGCEKINRKIVKVKIEKYEIKVIYRKIENF